MAQAAGSLQLPRFLLRIVQQRNLSFSWDTQKRQCLGFGVRLRAWRVGARLAAWQSQKPADKMRSLLSATRSAWW